MLLRWFSSHARDLPWRHTRDPYAIWVSEIMLQQTQVKTVIPYWERWMRELPTIHSVAKAKPARLHKLWEGLGYYTRVRNLQKAAQRIVSQHEAYSESCRRRGNESQTERRLETPHVVSYKFPEDFDAVLALPGIGRYTAGAICSIAFNQPRPILDGNVIRVLTRLFGIPTDPREKQTNARLWQLAEELVTHAARLDSSRSSRREEAHSKIRNLKSETRNGQSLLTSAATVKGSCSILNQSLMELGALICTPRSPQCEACPVQKLCVAFRENCVNELPNLGKRAAATARHFLAFVAERDGKFLVRQRAAGVVNAHLWEFPNVEIVASEGRACQSSARRPSTIPLRRARSDAPYRATGFKLTSPKPFCTIKHSITRYRITLEAFLAQIGESSSARPKNAGRRGTPPSEADVGRWLSLAQLARLPFTAAHKKILAQLGLERRAPSRPASSARKATRRNGVRRS